MNLDVNRMRICRKTFLRHLSNGSICIVDATGHIERSLKYETYDVNQITSSRSTHTHTRRSPANERCQKTSDRRREKKIVRICGLRGVCHFCISTHGKKSLFGFGRILGSFFLLDFISVSPPKFYCLPKTWNIFLLKLNNR